MDVSLPTALAQRIRFAVHPEETHHPPGEFVLYWMHNALRGHENPALDVAICFARQNGLPLLVYHGLSEDYPYASDRHHCFILQGHRDVQRELADRGIRSWFHLERDGHRGPHLRSLTSESAILVTEEMPLQPLAGWMERLISRTTAPIAMVDSSCIVPMPMLDKAYTRAFEFRNATQAIVDERLPQPYQEQELDCDFYDGAIPFEHCDLQDACLSELIGLCKVDHSVGPVADTPGGSRAGYRRWQQFKQAGLDDYAEVRNDASVRGVSRMSAYLHFGMVSPFRIAREAHQAGAEKYLDELVTWRELSFHFCNQNIDEIDSMNSIPQWAKKTLSEHASDQRLLDLSWESLARAQSGNDLWDSCQRSLIKHGELHNNVRMTWGKAILPWVSSPGRAMRLTMDLNHRFALDGRDPCSYGGVLWCFGQFDRPFKPETSYFGKVRTRPIAEHERRIDLKKYQALVDRPISANMPRVAVIGAGMAGLVAARTLTDHGVSVRAFEKSRGLGGRLATRTVRCVDGLTFDHGAQYFTARDRRFNRFVDSWMHDGLVEAWDGRVVELSDQGKSKVDKSNTVRFVGVPTMNAIANHLGNDLDVALETRIERLQKSDDDSWTLVDDQNQSHGPFDYVVVNAPPVQTLDLVRGHAAFDSDVAAAKMNPTWCVMLQADGLQSLDFDAAFINEGPLSWIARNSAKPSRQSSSEDPSPSAEAWVLHASTDWTNQQIDTEPDEVIKLLLEAFQASTGVSPTKVHYATAHRWLYAIPSSMVDQECLFDSCSGLIACGDWCGGPRVEGAFLSGMAAAGALLRHLTVDRCVGSGAGAAVAQ